MPTYEYRCRSCGHTFEVQQSFTDEPLRTCTRDGCEGELRKVFTPVGIVLKGSGFYRTDSRAGGTSKGSSSGGDGGSTSASSDTSSGSSSD